MTENGQNSAFYAARPKLFLDDRENENLSGGVLYLSIRETVQGLSCCEILLGNWGEIDGETDFLYFNRDVLDFGKKIGVQLGEYPNEKLLFVGRIMALEANYPKTRPPEIRILGEDNFQDLRMRRRSRSFEDVTDRDVFQQIASEHGLQAELDIDGPDHKILAQVNESDLAFLRARARAIDAEIWLDGSTLHAASRQRRNTERVTLNYGQELQEFSVCADLAHQQSKFIASGWDVSAKESFSHEAGADILGSELNGDLSGANILRQALGERTQVVVHATPLSAAETRILAETRFRQCARRFVTGTARAEGNTRVRVGTHVTFAGLGKLFNGTYYVSEVHHYFTAEEGYLTIFSVERSGIGQ